MGLKNTMNKTQMGALAMELLELSLNSKMDVEVTLRNNVVENDSEVEVRWYNPSTENVGLFIYSFDSKETIEKKVRVARYCLKRSRGVNSVRRRQAKEGF